MQHPNHEIRRDLLQRDYTYRKLSEACDLLDRELVELEQRPYQDTDQLARLKRQKLYLRDHMAYIELQQATRH